MIDPRYVLGWNKGSVFNPKTQGIDGDSWLLTHEDYKTEIMGYRLLVVEVIRVFNSV